MVGMRRLLLPAAVLLAVLGASAVLWPSWIDHTRDSYRARSSSDGPTAGRSAKGAAATDAPGASGGANGDESSSASAHVRGVVTGPTGVLWGVRIVAYRAGTGEVLAEAWSNPEGVYEMEVEPDVAFDLAAAPSDLTSLLPWRREKLMVAPGRELEEDVITLRVGNAILGRLVDERGDPVGGLVLRAIPEDPSAPGTVTGASHAAAVAKGTREGAFLLRGLAPGRYTLEIRDRHWMFPKPVSVPADGQELELLVVPGVQIDLSVNDIETGDPVPAFTVRATSEDLVLVEAAGKDGAFSTRVRWPGQLPPRDRWQAARRVRLEVAAPGFRPLDPFFNAEQVVWMIPVRESNTTIRVSFDDGNPYVGELMVTVKSKTTGGVGRVAFERDPKTGEFRGGLPWGDWEVRIIPSQVFQTNQYSGDARTGAGLEASLEVTLPGGGTIIFFPPPGVDHAIAHLERVWDQEGEGGRRDFVQRSFAVPPEGARVGGIPPGTYQIGVTRMVEVEPGRSIPMARYIRQITIDAKSLEQITLTE